MPDERKARPVSGEIMAAGACATEAASLGIHAADIVDAEFETLRPEPADRLCAAPGLSSIGTASAPAQGLAMLRRGVAAGSGGPKRGGPIFWTVGIGVALGAFWISGGHALVRPSPADISVGRPASANPLSISGVNSRVEDRGGRGVLFIDGSAVNRGDKEEPLPPIAISVTGNDGAVMHYRLGTLSDSLPPGGHFNFSTRLEAPKEGVKTVSVAFSG